MARIKVTGYLETSMMAPEDVDLDHESGLSGSGHLEWSDQLGMLDDLDFILER